MAISKITTAPQPIEEIQKINEIIDGLDAKADDDAVVKLTGDQAIDGIKNFSGHINIRKNITDSAGAYLNLIKADDDSKYASIRHYLTADGANYSRLQSSAYDTNAYADVRVLSDGTRQFACNSGCDVAYAPAGGTKAHSILTHEAGGTKTNPAHMHLGNGILVQWGYVNVSSSTTTITFAKPFSTADYRIVATARGDNGQIYSPAIKKNSSSSCVLYTNGGASSLPHEWIAIGWA